MMHNEHSFGGGLTVGKQVAPKEQNTLQRLRETTDEQSTNNDIKIETAQAQVIRSFAPGVLNVRFDGLLRLKDDDLISPSTLKNTSTPATLRFKGSAETQREYSFYLNEKQKLKESRNVQQTTLNLQG